MVPAFNTSVALNRSMRKKLMQGEKVMAGGPIGLRKVQAPQGRRYRGNPVG